jgi:hypothetical protein
MAESFIVRTPFCGRRDKRDEQRRKFFESDDSSENKISKISKKDVDRSVTIVLLGTLSLIGKLFEIYFVRLIGTPNQQFKYRYARPALKPVSQ